MKKIKKGCYIITNKENKDEIYLILISGFKPFLKIKVIWDLSKNIIVNDDVLRSKDFKWIKFKNYK